MPYRNFYNVLWKGHFSFKGYLTGNFQQYICYMFRNQAGPSEFYMVIQLLTLYKVTKKYSKNFFSSTQIIGHKPPENDGFYYFSIGTKRFYHFSSFFIIIRGSSSKTNVILESPSKTTSNQVDSRKNFLRSKTIEKYRKS